MANENRLAIAAAARRMGWSQIAMGQLTEAGASLDEGLRMLDAMPRASMDEERFRTERVMLYFEMSRLGAWAGDGKKAIEYARKAVAEHEKLPVKPLEHNGIATTRMQLADAADTYGRGDKQLSAEALRQTRLAVQAVRDAGDCQVWSCREAKAAVLTRAPIVFMHHLLLEEALSLRDGVDLAENLLAEDPGNASVVTSLRFGLLYLGWTLEELGRLEESLQKRRRLLEISVVFAGTPGSAEARLNEAIACIEVGRTLVRLKRLHEAQGFFERGAEILADPPTENVYWYMRQTDVYQDLGLLYDALGRPKAARAEFAKQSQAASMFLSKTGSALAKELEASAHYLHGKSLLAVDNAAGCRLLRKSLNRFDELTKGAELPNKYWEEQSALARLASRGCGF